MKSFSNSNGKANIIELPRCPRCGLYSGERRCTVNLPEKYYIVCSYCGYKVGGYSDKASATRLWKMESEEKWNHE